MQNMYLIWIVYGIFLAIYSHPSVAYWRLSLNLMEFHSNNLK